MVSICVVRGLEILRKGASHRKSAPDYNIYHSKSLKKVRNTSKRRNLQNCELVFIAKISFFSKPTLPSYSENCRDEVIVIPNTGSSASSENNINENEGTFNTNTPPPPYSQEAMPMPPPSNSETQEGPPPDYWANAIKKTNCKL